VLLSVNQSDLWVKTVYGIKNHYEKNRFFNINHYFLSLFIRDSGSLFNQRDTNSGHSIVLFKQRKNSVFDWALWQHSYHTGFFWIGMVVSEKISPAIGA
jgi:hypothetical protein